MDIVAKPWATIGDRIKRIRKAKNLSQKEFGSNISISQGNLSDYEKDKVQPGDRIVKDIITHYKVKYFWWDTGEGNIFHDSNFDYRETEEDFRRHLPEEAVDQILVNLRRSNLNLPSAIDLLSPEELMLFELNAEGLTYREIALKTNLSIDLVKDGVKSAYTKLQSKFDDAVPVSLVDEKFVTTTEAGSVSRDLDNGMVLMTIPLVPEYAYASYPRGWKYPEYIEELPKHSIVLPKPDSSRYMAFTVRGDSMNDGSAKSICEGDIATGRLIEPGNWNNRTYMLVGKDYIIVNAEGIVVKRLSKYDSENGLITCSSTNPNKANYPDYDIRLSEVYQVFLVVKVEREW